MQIPAGAEAQFAAFLGGDDSAAAGLLAASGSAGESPATTQDSQTTLAGFRDQLRGEQNLVIIFGAEIRGSAIASLVKFGSGIPGAKFICLGDYANSRGRCRHGSLS